MKGLERCPSASAPTAQAIPSFQLNSVLAEKPVCKGLLSPEAPLVGGDPTISSQPEAGASSTHRMVLTTLTNITLFSWGQRPDASPASFWPQSLSYIWEDSE